ncbi:hypothetical protein JL721_1277 [Aureococcus anophagefferens]|nr:hypothetical protein JL721_1277 [Aureococcus anophagefferens]
MRLLAASLVALACVADESCSPWYDEDCIAVVCCGDSITEGADVEAGEDWPSLLQDLLGAQYRVYNKGLSGHTLTATDVEWAASEQGEGAMEITVAGVFIVGLGTNDAKDEYWSAPGFNETYIDEYGALIATLRGLGTNPEPAEIFVTIPPPQLEANTLWPDTSFINEELRRP